MGFRLLCKLLLLIGTAYLSACADRADIQSVINSAVQTLPTAGPSGGGKDDDDSNPLSLSDARVILRADALLGRGGSQPPPDAAGEKLTATESYQRLKQAAESRLRRHGPLPTPDENQFRNFSETEIGTVKNEARTLFLRLSHDYEVATGEQAILRMMDAEARLAVILDGLKGIVTKDQVLPDDAFSLAPRQNLQFALDSLRTHKRRIDEILAVTGNTNDRAIADYLAAQITRVEKVISSDNYAHFQKQTADIFDKISKKRWDEFTAGWDLKIEMQKARIAKLAEAFTGWKEIQRVSAGIRGPPLGLGDLLYTSIREYNLDPASWVRNEARLLALADELFDKETIPESYRTPASSPYVRIASLLSDSSLERAATNVNILLREIGDQDPSTLIFPERRRHLEELAAALLTEKGRRAKGGVAVKLTTTPEEMLKGINKLGDLVKQYTQPKEALPTKRAQAHFLNIMQSRFPNHDSIPTGMRDEVRKVLKTTVDEYVLITADLTREYSKVSREMALSTTAVSNDLLKKQRETKEYITAIFSELDPIVTTAEQYGVDVQESKKTLDTLSGLRPRGPPKGGSSTTLLPPFNPKRPSPGTGAGEFYLTHLDLQRLREPNLFRRYHPRLDKYLYRIQGFMTLAKERIEESKSMTAQLSSDPIKFATAKGRLVASVTDLRNQNLDLRKITLDNSNARLPKANSNWEGRLDATGKPFPYPDVKQPKTFRALGGGIHIGETATVSNDVDLSGATLTFEPDRGLIIRDGKSGKEWILDTSIDPTSLKALYRFAVAGRNAAISIGWGVEAMDTVARLRTAILGESVVLLDPYLVDTKVGQDFVLADTIPWELGKDLPNGNPIPFAKQFNELRASYSADDRDKLKNFVTTIKPFDLSELPSWRTRLAKSDTTEFSLTLLQEDSLNEEVKKAFISTELRRQLRQEKVEENITGDPVESLRSYFRKLIRKEIEDKFPLYKRRNVDSEKLNELLEAQTQSAVADTIAKHKTNFEKLPKDLMRLRDIFIQRDLVFALTAGARENRAVVELWCAWQRKKGQNVGAIADALYVFIDPTTLAVLYDDSVQMKLNGNGSHFIAQLKYRYATTHLTITDTYVGRGASPNDDKNEIKTLNGLTELVNNHVIQLAESFPPLKRVQRYAGIAALFRWAENAVRDGKLGVLDLSELGAYPGNDRSKFPTVDVVKRR